MDEHTATSPNIFYKQINLLRALYEVVLCKTGAGVFGVKYL